MASVLLRNPFDGARNVTRNIQLGFDHKPDPFPYMIMQSTTAATALVIAVALAWLTSVYQLWY